MIANHKSGEGGGADRGSAGGGTAGAFFRAALRAQWRSALGWRLFLVAWIFSLALIFIFRFAIDSDLPGARVAVGAGWLIYLFAIQAGLNLALAPEEEGQLGPWLRSLPLPAGAYLSAKFVFLGLWGAAVAAIFSLEMSFFFQSSPQFWLGAFLPACLAVLPGLAGSQIFALGLLRDNPWRPLLLPVLLFPLWVPLALSGLRWALDLGSGPMALTPAGFLALAQSALWIVAAYFSEDSLGGE